MSEQTTIPAWKDPRSDMNKATALSWARQLFTADQFATLPDFVQATFYAVNSDRVNQSIRCCEKAYAFYCVCAYNRRCPDHGEVHVGTHD